jgi:hypothetical protein
LILDVPTYAALGIFAHSLFEKIRLSLELESVETKKKGQNQDERMGASQTYFVRRETPFPLMTTPLLTV